MQGQVVFVKPKMFPGWPFPKQLCHSPALDKGLRSLLPPVLGLLLGVTGGEDTV